MLGSYMPFSVVDWRLKNYCKMEFGNTGVEFLRHVVREARVMFVASEVIAISTITIPTHQ